ncbi:MAG: RnfABCDGE type electron transport complex subunit G [Gammaproteobacteria bacterium]|nr:RnfABCDGE type electron transport complex subunit G [Gammaproteobacteria bacterium]
MTFTALTVLTAAGLSALSTHSAERIDANQRAWDMRQINELLSATDYDNDIFSDVIVVEGTAPDAQLLGTGAPHEILRARKNGQPAAAILRVTAASGYSGPIELLVAIYADGTVAGVRAARHRETPGLGDRIEIERSSWMTGFEGRSLQAPPLADWAIRRDDGVFDQITGASVTSRAVTSAVRDALQYFEAHKTPVFAAPDVAGGSSQ